MTSLANTASRPLHAVTRVIMWANRCGHRQKVKTVSTGIGARVPRKEDARHLTGKAQFVSDIAMPRLWEVAFVRSPLAHARLKGVHVPEQFLDLVVYRRGP